MMHQTPRQSTAQRRGHQEKYTVSRCRRQTQTEIMCITSSTGETTPQLSGSVRLIPGLKLQRPIVGANKEHILSKSKQRIPQVMRVTGVLWRLRCRLSIDSRSRHSYSTSSRCSHIFSRSYDI